MRNVVPNPAFRATSGTAEARRNIGVSPRAVSGGWNTNNAAYWTVALNTPVPGPHPQGIATCAKVTSAAGAGKQLASLNSVDGLGNSGTSRGIGVWVVSPIAANVTIYLDGNQAGTKRVTAIPANAWAYCTSAAAGTGNAIVIVETADGANAPVPTVSYFTGCIAEADTAPASFFDGSTPSAGGLTHSWTGTAGSSASIATGTAVASWSASGGASVVRGPGVTYGYTVDLRARTGNALYSANIAATPGGYYSARGIVRAVPGEAIGSVSMRLYDTTAAAFISDSVAVTPPSDGSPVEVTTTATVPVGSGGTIRVYVYGTLGTSVRVSTVIASPVSGPGVAAPSYFDGTWTGALWEGTADASVSLIPEMTATYDPDYIRVGVEGKDFADSVPVDITRDGEPVRGGESLQPSGGSFFLWDYEAPYSTPLGYVADFGTGTASADSVTVPVTEAWLRAPGLPSLDLPILPREVPAVTRPRPSTTLRPLGRRKPVVLSTARAAGEFVLNVWTRNDSEADALQALADEAAVALLLMPGARGVEHVYVALGDIEESPLAGHLTGSESWRLWSLPATIVDSPIGGVYGDPTATYQVVVDTFATYTALNAGRANYLSVLRGA